MRVCISAIGHVLATSSKRGTELDVSIDETQQLLRGRPTSNDTLYEAHIFLLVEPDASQRIDELIRPHKFRRGRRANLERLDKAMDIIITRNHDDLDEIETATRTVAAHLRQNGFNVYRIRLERTVFDEIFSDRGEQDG